MVPACSCGALTNVLPHKNAMPQTEDMTPHLFRAYRHRADLSLCYSLIGKIFPDLPHTPANAQLYDAVIVVVSKKLGRKCTIPAES